MQLMKNSTCSTRTEQRGADGNRLQLLIWMLLGYSPAAQQNIYANGKHRHQAGLLSLTNCTHFQTAVFKMLRPGGSREALWGAIPRTAPASPAAASGHSQRPDQHLQLELDPQPHALPAHRPAAKAAVPLRLQKTKHEQPFEEARPLHADPPGLDR